MKIRGSLLLLMVAFSFQVIASPSKKIEFELRIQEYLTQIMRNFDPSAQVLVNVRPKEIKTVIPFTDIEVGGEMPFQDIDAISVRVVTALNPIPDELKNRLMDAVALPKERKLFVYSPTPKSLVELYSKTHEEDHSWKHELLEKVRRIWIVTFAVLIVSLFAVTWLRSRNQSALMAKLTQSMPSASAPSLDMEAPLPLPSPLSAKSAENFESSKESLDLPLSAWVELFADCYWTESDAYAAFLWKQAPLTKRAELIQSWPLDPDYFLHFTAMPPEPDDIHLHPYYLGTQSVAKTSQADLKTHLQRHPGLWKKLSPLRKKHLEVGLRERISFSYAESKDKVFIAPPESRTQRPLKTRVEFGKITESDEMLVLEDPSLIPEDLRAQFQSLVWFGLLDAPKKEAILKARPAVEIAEALLGPSSIVEQILSALPDRKRNLVEQYMSRVPKSRNSPAFQSLVKDCIDALPRNGNDGEALRAA